MKSLHRVCVHSFFNFFSFPCWIRSRDSIRRTTTQIVVDHRHYGGTMITFRACIRNFSSCE